MQTKMKMRETIDQQLFDAAGVLLQFLAPPEEPGDGICLIRGTMPPGVAVPLHMHAGPEIFCVLDGSVEVYLSNNKSSQKAGPNAWTTSAVGDVISIPGNAKHALRNRSSNLLVILLVATKSRLYKFFRETAKPFDRSQRSAQATSAAVQELFAVATKYGYWMASPEENAAIGLSIGQKQKETIESESRRPLFRITSKSDNFFTSRQVVKI